MQYLLSTPPPWHSRGSMTFLALFVLRYQFSTKPTRRNRLGLDARKIYSTVIPAVSTISGALFSLLQCSIPCRTEMSELFCSASNPPIALSLLVPACMPALLVEPMTTLKDLFAVTLYSLTTCEEVEHVQEEWCNAVHFV